MLYQTCGYKVPKHRGPSAYSDILGPETVRRICHFMQDCWLTLSTFILYSSCPWGRLTEQPKAGESTMPTTMQEDVMVNDERRRAEDEKKPAIDNTERHHTKLVSPEIYEMRHVDQLETHWQAEQRAYSQKGCNETSREK